MTLCQTYHLWDLWCYRVLYRPFRQCNVTEKSKSKITCVPDICFTFMLPSVDLNVETKHYSRNQYWKKRFCSAQHLFSKFWVNSHKCGTIFNNDISQQMSFSQLIYVCKNTEGVFALKSLSTPQLSEYFG